MTRKEIEARIKFIQIQLSKETNVSTLAMLNRCLEGLIMMESDEEREVRRNEVL